MRRQWLLISSFSVTLHACVILLLGLIPSRPIAEAESEMIELLLMPAEESGRQESSPEILLPQPVIWQPEALAFETRVLSPPVLVEMPAVIIPVDEKDTQKPALAAHSETVPVAQKSGNAAAVMPVAGVPAEIDVSPDRTGADSGSSARPQTFAQPNYGRNPAPAYPALAQRRRQQGTVLLGVIVTTNGVARNVKVKRSSGFRLLDESAVNTVGAAWTFSPARLGDHVVESEVELPITFSLP